MKTHYLITNPYPVQHVAKNLVIALAMVLFQDYRLEFWPKGVYHVPGKSLLGCKKENIGYILLSIFGKM